MSDKKNIHRARVIIYEERWFCQNCGGDMEHVPSPWGFMRTTHRHRCRDCGHTDRADQMYPRVIYEEDQPASLRRAIGY